MNELFDKLILRIIFVVIICLILVFYRFSHRFFFPYSKKLFGHQFHPTKNSPDTIHLFSRILGIGILFSQFHFHMSNGFIIAVVDFLIKSLAMIFIYFVSNFIIEGIILYNFEHDDEIVKRRNYAYALMIFTQSIGIAYILRTVLTVSGNSLLILFMLWLLSMVLLGFATKTFSIMSKLNLNLFLVKQNIAISFSYMGFFWGWVLLISTSLAHPMENIKWYIIQAILKILLSLIILPLFINALKIIFKIKDDFDSESLQDDEKASAIESGYGIYEGLLFFTSCFLTIIITEQIHFGTFYPKF